MKKVTNQKVRLSKTAKKILAGTLATSMVFSGTMVAFAEGEDAGGEASEAVTAGDVDFSTATLNNDVNGVTVTDVDDRSDVITFGDNIATDQAVASVVGVEVTNPFDSDAMYELLDKSYGDAFAAYGKAFNGLTVKSGSGDDAYDVPVVKTADNKLILTKAEAMKAYEDAVSAAAADAVSSGAISSVEEFSEASKAAVQYTNKEGAVTPGAVSGEFVYPLPKWENGVTISTWVKVAEGTKSAAPIFTFESADKKQGLALRTDGIFIFGDNKTKNTRDQYVALFSGKTPYDNQGEWIYVTVSFKNDGAKVYYNGVEASVTNAGNSDESYTQTGCRYFNGRFGPGTHGLTDEDRIKKACTESVYDNLLQLVKGNNADMSKYSVDAGSGMTMMNLLTAQGTKLYVGGGDSSAITGHWNFYRDNKSVNGYYGDPENYYYYSYAGTEGTEPGAKYASYGLTPNFPWGGCTKYNEGLQISELSYTAEVLDDAGIAYALYAAATEPDDVTTTVPTEEPTGTPSGAPTEDPGNETEAPTEDPGNETEDPGNETEAPTGNPTEEPTGNPSEEPTGNPTEEPTGNPSEEPTVEPSVAPSEDPDFKYGDLTGKGEATEPDGEVTLEDALKALRYALSIDRADEDAIKRGDVTGPDGTANGEIEMDDALQILRVALSIQREFDVEKSQAENDLLVEIPNTSEPDPTEEAPLPVSEVVQAAMVVVTAAKVQ